MDVAIELYEPTDLRRKVGVVLQSAPLLCTTIYKNLALPRKLQGTTLSKEEAVAVQTQFKPYNSKF